MTSLPAARNELEKPIKNITESNGNHLLIIPGISIVSCMAIFNAVMQKKIVTMRCALSAKPGLNSIEYTLAKPARK
ncbi:hypothetical protein FACS1894199_06140 [Bacteroidia bacterium]|nr:hypothetical protein FACS1894199_06140 [Bacteroidia bacterium]